LPEGQDQELGAFAWMLVILGVVVTLAFGLINLSINVQRWHDRDKSGFWIFIVMIPFVGGLWAFIETGLLPGTPTVNRFGPPPGSTFESTANRVFS
ncbi:MAG: DUF805 domain-containing protein, partial [Luteolibacter sp.]